MAARLEGATGHRWPTTSYAKGPGNAILVIRQYKWVWSETKSTGPLLLLHFPDFPVPVLIYFVMPPVGLQCSTRDTLSYCAVFCVQERRLVQMTGQRGSVLFELVSEYAKHLDPM